MNPELKIYTIADVRSWLLRNRPPMGLSEQLIAPARAYAILNNPYVKDDDAVLSAIFEDDTLVAYTACFPDMFNGKRVWWASTLWCSPQSQGKGYGMVAVGSLMETHESELTFDRWGAVETIEIFNCFEYYTTYSQRYIFGDKAIYRNTFKSKVVYFIQACTKLIRHRRCPVFDYTLKYSTFIDGETYAFISAHHAEDLFLREQKMLNWIMQNPFMQCCCLKDRVQDDTAFSANVEEYRYALVKVFVNGALVGVYQLRRKDGLLSVLYLYYEEKEKNSVFASIVEHIQKQKVIGFQTEHRPLADYVAEHIYFPRQSVEQISFSVPNEMALPPHFTMQMGDGDSFA